VGRVPRSKKAGDAVPRVPAPLFLPARFAVLPRVLALAMCPYLSVSVCLFAISRCSIEVDGRIELVFDVGTSFSLSNVQQSTGFQLRTFAKCFDTVGWAAGRASGL